MAGTLQGDLLVFGVDFNDLNAEDRLVASRRFAASHRTPEMNELVVAQDDEGNVCQGRIRRVGSRTVDIELARDTWSYQANLQRKKA